MISTSICHRCMFYYSIIRRRRRRRHCQPHLRHITSYTHWHRNKRLSIYVKWNNVINVVFNFVEKKTANARHSTASAVTDLHTSWNTKKKNKLNKTKTARRQRRWEIICQRTRIYLLVFFFFAVNVFEHSVQHFQVQPASSSPSSSFSSPSSFSSA